jgi:hypothetical protein
MGLTFALTVFAWIFFRSESLHHAFHYLKEIFSSSLLTKPEIKNKAVVILIGVFLLIEWLGREHTFGLEKMSLKWPTPVRWAFYYLIVVLIFLYGGSEQQFIYFQF